MARLQSTSKHSTPSLPNYRIQDRADITLPNEIAGLELWLRADSINHLVNGGSVDYWRDESQGNNSCSASGAAQPTWHIDEINGYPVVRFDGTDDELQANSPHTPVLANILIVFKYNDGATWDNYDGIAGGTSAGDANDVRLMANGATDAELWTTDLDVPGGGWAHIDGATSHDPDLGDLTAWHIISAYDNNGTALAGNYQLAHDRQNAGRFASCDIAEIIGYEAELSTANELKVVTYLNDKYEVY